MRLFTLSRAVFAATLIAGVLLLASAVQGLTRVDENLRLASLQAPEHETAGKPGWWGECDRRDRERV